MVLIIRFAGYLYNWHAEIDHEFNFIKLLLNNRKKKCIRMQEKQSIKAQNKKLRIITLARMLLPQSGSEKYEFSRIYGLDTLIKST